MVPSYPGHAWRAWEVGESLRWRALVTLGGWRDGLGCVQTITRKRFLNRVKGSVVCQVDRGEYIRKHDLSLTNVPTNEYKTLWLI